MKVLNISQLLDPKIGGGTAERTLQMSRYLAGAGADVTIVSFETDLPDHVAKLIEGTKVVTFPYLLKRIYFPLILFSEIRKLVREADIVHMMNHWNIFNLLFYFALRLEQKPYVFCPAGAFQIYGRSIILKRLFSFLVGDAIAQNAEMCIAISEDEIDHFSRAGVPKEKIVHIPNGIDEYKKVDRWDQFPFLKGSPYLFYLGRLNPIKGPDLLIEAFINSAEKFPSYHLVMAGTDEGMGKELIGRVKDANLENRVHFVGFLSGDDKICAIQYADLMIIPSRREAMSIVVLEAGILETPVILTDRCGLNELLEKEVASVVEASSTALENALDENLSLSIELLAERGRLFREWVQENYLWKNIVGRYLNLYEGIIQGR